MLGRRKEGVDEFGVRELVGVIAVGEVVEFTLEVKSLHHLRSRLYAPQRGAYSRLVA